MSHGRPPRRQRPQRLDIMGFVINRATRLTEVELRQIMDPIDDAHKALREGVASEMQWAVLCTAVELGLAIEDKRIVRGLRGHLQAAERALAGIRGRAMQSGAWTPTALYYQELDDVGELVRLHHFQLQQISAGELDQIHRIAQQRVRQAGGRVLEAPQMEQASLYA